MDEPTKPALAAFDPQTDKIVGMPFAWVRDTLRAENPISPNVPSDVRALLDAAVDYVALSSEQTTAQRGGLSNQLKNDANLKALLALESAVRTRLAAPATASFEELIEQARALRLVGDAPEWALVERELERSRDRGAYALRNRLVFAGDVRRLLRFIVAVVNCLSDDAAQ